VCPGTLTTEQNIVGGGPAPRVGDQPSPKRLLVIGDLIAPFLAHVAETLTGSLRCDCYVARNLGNVSGKSG
jgi:hypothetical protein